MPRSHPANPRIIQPIRIRSYHFDQAFTVAFHSPQIKRFHADSVIVRIDFENGISGYGESAPRPYVTGETCQSVAKLIAQHFAPLIFNQPVDSIPAVETLLHRLEDLCRHKGIKAYTSALGAIDLALLDALERARRVAPRALFPDDRRQELRLSVSVPFLPLDMIRAAYPLFRRHFDFAILKILVSDDVDETCERVALIRELAGHEAELRLEFNGKTTFSRVKAILERLAPYRIRAVEQPLPASHHAQLQQLREQFDLGFVADESLVTLQDAQALIDHQAYTIFNIKVSKCGGLLRSKQIAELAQAHGIPCQVGTHVGESTILGIAGRRLARSLPFFDCYGGGSEVLFSYLFESDQQAADTSWPPPAEGDILDLATCRDLVAQSKLLEDSPATGQPNRL